MAFNEPVLTKRIPLDPAKRKLVLYDDYVKTGGYVALRKALEMKPDEIIKTGLLYVVIGIFHYVFRKQFLLISTDPKTAAARGMAIRFWDFLFYASFGVVVTRSVAIAGVLLVFCYLIVPSVGAMLFAETIGARLAIGWIMGVIVSMLGMYFSVEFDLPTGATIVCTFGAVLVAMAAVRVMVPRTRAQPV